MVDHVATPDRRRALLAESHDRAIPPGDDHGGPGSRFASTSAATVLFRSCGSTVWTVPIPRARATPSGVGRSPRAPSPSHRRRRARLVAGHRRDPVVEHDDDHVVAGLRRVEQGRHAGVEEGGIADEGQGLLAQHAARRRGHGDRRAHGEQRVGGLQRRAVAQRVAADVVEVDPVVAEDRAGGQVGPAVRAARAERRRPRGQLRAQPPLSGRSRGVPANVGEGAGDDVGVVGERLGKVAGALAQDLDLGADLVGQRPELVLEKRRQLLDDQHPVHAPQKLLEDRARQRLGRPDVLDRQPVLEAELLHLVEDQREPARRRTSTPDRPEPVRAKKGESASSASALRERSSSSTRMRRALTGIGVSSAGRRRNSGGSARPWISPASTIPRVWATGAWCAGSPAAASPPKARRRNGSSHTPRPAWRARAPGSCSSRARCRWSCSFGETTIPGSPAETMTIPASTPTYGIVPSGSPA